MSTREQLQDQEEVLKLQDKPVVITGGKIALTAALTGRVSVAALVNPVQPRKFGFFVKFKM